MKQQEPEAQENEQYSRCGRSFCTITPQHLVAGATLFSAWGDRMWNFAIGVYLIKLTPGSLRLAAIYGLAWTFFAIVFTPAVGAWIDRTPRIKVIRYSLLMQNLLVIVDAITLLVVFEWPPKSDGLMTFIYVVIIVFGASANVIAQGEKISIAKDWIVVVCKGDKTLLAESNALLRRIDLTVAIVSPIAVGFAMSIVSTYASIIFICMWDLFSFFAEYFLLLKVYKDIPELRFKNDDEESVSLLGNKKSSLETEGRFVEVKSGFDVVGRLKGFILGWRVYYKQDVFLAGLTLAVVYLTCLGFNAITTGYAYTQGLTALSVSLCYAAGSLVGIFGTLLFPYMRLKFGLLKTGAIGSFSQLIMLMLCVVAIWAPGSPSLLKSSNWHSQNNTSIFSGNSKLSNNTLTTQAPLPKGFNYTSIILVMAGIILSRTGLWLLDLSITQLQQENIPEHERGIVGGVQYALNEVFDLSHFIITIFLPRANEFGYLTLVTFGAITTSAIIFQIFVYRFPRRRKVEYETLNGTVQKSGSINIKNGDINNEPENDKLQTC